MKSLFNKRIKELREKKGISYKELADYLNVKESDIINWENNVCEPRNTLTTLVKLSKYFNVDADYILGLK